MVVEGEIVLVIAGVVWTREALVMNDVGRIDGTTDVIDCEGAIVVEERCFVTDDDTAATVEGVLEADERCMVDINGKEEDEERVEAVLATVVYAAVVDITDVEVDRIW